MFCHLAFLIREQPVAVTLVLNIIKLFYILSKEPYILSKEPCILSLTSLIREQPVAVTLVLNIIKLFLLFRRVVGGALDLDVDEGYKTTEVFIKRALHAIKRALYSINRA